MLIHPLPGCSLVSRKLEVNLSDLFGELDRMEVESTPPLTANVLSHSGSKFVSVVERVE